MSLLEELQIVVAVLIIGGSLWTTYCYVIEPIHAIIRRELRPNGGSSMLDRLKKVEENQSNQYLLLKSIDKKLTQHLEYSGRQDGRLEEHLRSHNHETI